MNSIYRCRAKVAFKPARSENVIVFPERQIDSVSVKLKQNVSGFETITTGGVDKFYYNFKGNECTITLNDPYLDGIAWPALENIGEVLSGSSALMNTGTLLPKCEKGQDPGTTPCYPFYDKIDDPDLVNRSEGRGWIIISLYYEIEGIGITSEFQTYFRATKVTIDHGSKYPQVTMRGEYAFNADFNQTIPVFFEKGEPVLKQMNDKIFSKAGYKIESVCGEDEDEVSEKSYKNTALSPGQLLQKYSEEKEFTEAYISAKAENAKIIQICNKIDYSCRSSKVFYLGKGLYKQYSINAEYNQNSFADNTSQPKVDDPESKEPLPGLDKVGEGEFKYDRHNTKTTEKKKDEIEKKSPNAFKKLDKQFDEIADYSTANQAKVVFKGEASKLSKFTVEKLEKNTPFGNAKEGIAYLGGIVTSVSKEEGRVVIRSPFILYLSSTSKDNPKSAAYSIHQEYTSLTGISVKEKQEIEYGTKVGDVQEGDKQTKTRYFIKPPQDGSSVISLDPPSVGLAMSTEESLTDKEKEDQGPDSSDKSNPDGPIIGWVGNTGNSSAPHLHAEIRSSGKGPDTAQPVTAASFDPYITIGGKKPSQWVTTSNHGSQNPDRPGHKGVDIAGTGILGQPIRLINGKFTETGIAGRYGTFSAADIGGGKEIFLAHLLAKPPAGKDLAQIGSSAANKTTSGDLSKGGGGPRPDKYCFQLKTEFQGVPRSLEIEPGKTVVSFITSYDDWIEGGKDDTQVDPGVWIPDQYRNWFINETEWKWDKGNLKVVISAIRRPGDRNQDWEGAIPTFSEYLQDYDYTSYYDYIRSPSDLCYKRKTDKKLSCSECGKPPSNRGGTGENNATSQTDVKSEFPAGKFKYTCNGRNQSTVQAILDAGSALGVTNKMGLAAIVGNAIQESRLNPTAKNTAGANEFGLFQWNPSPGAQRFQLLERYVADNGGDINSVGTQLNFFVWEVNNYSSLYGNLASELNNASSAEDAAIDFERIYEKSSDTPGSTGYNNRINYTQEIFDCLTEQ